ncbi:hypothetical protein FA95DRAFT_1554535 [Auriscalpium vulgare]|uniref:Uncharacterized protein n=1 Tax=Auriscalpium vulgare TaxID=40419 RepID=A0ACB8S5J1_9AGAM|nr:hypothetical protein FA95DRAFT_1554535 [Auriscalpium vulgare]
MASRTWTLLNIRVAVPFQRQGAGWYDAPRPSQVRTDHEHADFLVPAIHGTVGILEPVKRHGYVRAYIYTSVPLTTSSTSSSSFKRVVITSSNAAIYTSSDKPVVFDESDRNDPSVQQVEEKGVDTPPDVVYCASKTLAKECFVASSAKGPWSQIGSRDLRWTLDGSPAWAGPGTVAGLGSTSDSLTSNG